MVRPLARFDSTSTSATARSVGDGFRAANRCRHPIRWGAPAPGSDRRSLPWSWRCRRTWAFRWRRSFNCSGARFGLTVTPGGVAQVLHRAARDAAPAYTTLCEQVRHAPVVTPNETGWPVGGERHWPWVFATPDTTVYAIRPGRGFDDALSAPGADFNGVLIHDGWAPYRCFDDALHQTCVARLLRRCKHLRDDHPDSTWAVQIEAALQAGLALRATVATTGG